MANNTETARQVRTDARTVAASMNRAMSNEAGTYGKFDAARKVFRETEGHLLNRVVAGSPRAFQRLDALRKSPLGFAPSIQEGVALDYGPRGARVSGYMRSNGDFELPLGRHVLPYHPAVLGYRPRVIPLQIPPTPPCTTRGDTGGTARSNHGTERTTARMSARDTARYTSRSTGRSNIAQLNTIDQQAPSRRDTRRQIASSR